MTGKDNTPPLETTTLTGVPEGFDCLQIAHLATASKPGQEAQPYPRVLHIARDDRRLDDLEAGLKFFAPDVRVISFPAWDTVPYDRIGPKADIVAKRITALAKLAIGAHKSPTIVLTTANAILQRVPSRTFIRQNAKQMSPGQRIDMSRLVKRLSNAGYIRSSTVMEPGEYAQRGGILDLFPPARVRPVRLDFFGDTLESIKTFDAKTQRTLKPLKKLVLLPISEVALGSDAEKRFRARYVEQFGGATNDDPLYEAISSGHRYQGQEHWISLFNESLETLFDYLPNCSISFDHKADDVIGQRVDQIHEHYQARVEGLEVKAFGAPPYKPVPPDAMYLDHEGWLHQLTNRSLVRLSPFDEASRGSTQTMNGRLGRTFAPERQASEVNVFDAVVEHIHRHVSENRRVIIAAWTPGARERLSGLLRDHGLADFRTVDSYHDALALPGDVPGLAVLGLERGFETPELVIIAEQDILGDRLVRPRRRQKRAADVLTEATSLSVSDLVVHADHGIGSYRGLRTITAGGYPHDCLELEYAGGDKLFLPVENIELLTRYGGDNESGHQLDKLGGASWQTRKSRLKQRLREIAGELIKVAARRALRQAPALTAPTGSYDEFIAKFPFDETDDQAASIEAVQGDLASGRPMDRLVCGDVGFGKTEVALRAAFIAALNGQQVAVVVPTTLLSRQHYKTFSERFTDLPVRVAQLSRLVPTKEMTEIRAGLKNGDIDIVVGTHALLGKNIEFKRLGLLVIDEEQRFGVNHKERLKKLRDDVHVLTLSATPIPRTLQLALTGVRELSLITTPPVDRLAVRTYISPFDPVILRDALRRERFRGGQTYFVVPRIKDLKEAAEFLTEAAPELRVAQAHGQLTPTELEDVMTAFYEGNYDVLLSTAIVESGLDVPNANTLIVYRAEMFGLAQLYQLRGRVGRSKTRAYAYFTTPPEKSLTDTAEKRLKVLQSLDTLGAGFSLASHDLDIRGSGNLLGEEQSGHIREVGFELYQSMLEEAIAAMRGGDADGDEEKWTPEISLGTAILIPESFVADLQLRLNLYRRLASLESRAEIDDFAVELVDRFGPLPDEVKHLLDVMEIKELCRKAGIIRVDAGPKGAMLSFFKDSFANPEGLLLLLQNSNGRIKLQKDHKLIVKGNWDLPDQRLAGVRNTVKKLSELAAENSKAA